MTPHDKQISPAIKEAAKLYCSKYNHGYQDQLKEIFCDAALHPETEKYYREKITQECVDELLKQLMDVIYANGYPIKAAPQAAILSLPAIMKMKSLTKNKEDEGNRPNN